MSASLEKIARKFISGAAIASIHPYGSGHINDTYLVTTVGDGYDYILQRINHKIFKDVGGMSRNIMAVTGHLKAKLAAMPGHDPFRETLNLVMAANDRPYVEDEAGNFWRMFVFIPGMRTIEKAPDAGTAFESGRIIGRFHCLLADIHEPVTDTLPGFHSVHRREREFREAFVADPQGRILKTGKDVLFVEELLPGMRNYYDSFQGMGFPMRIVHYDTKLNNILFDEQGKAVCLIDLDTVCPGYVHFDYGDALRTLANTAAEDEKDLSKVRFNIPYYEAFKNGYISEAGDLLSDEEMKMLPHAPIYLTFLIGLRFLTDYLNGDTYYKTTYPDHNLVRARVQFKLVAEMAESIERGA